MINTIGLIFLISVINVSSSLPLRELDFIESLYPHGNAPNMLLTSMVNRRIDQVSTLYERKSIYQDTKTFYNATEKSLILLLEAIEPNDTSIGEIFESYSHIVQLMNDVYFDVSLNADYLAVNSQTSPSREKLQNMIDAYIGDIEMVRKCEVSMGRADRVDMKIVERIKSLSNELRNYYFYSDDRRFHETDRVSRKTVDQCLWQFKFLLNKFKKTFIRYQE